MKTPISKNPGIKELPESERPREKIFAHGVSFLSNTELIAVLLGYGDGRSSALDLASKLLSSVDSITAFSAYQPEEFMQVPGIGTAKACTLVAAIELGRRLASSPLGTNTFCGNPAAAAALFMEEMRYLKKETFCVALFNVKNELIMKDYVSTGGLNFSSAHPREVFSNALKKGASSVILVHNHPSGDPTPSASDISTTRQLCEAGEILGVRVLDHIIIGDGKYLSFKKESLL